jgi:hypothetical protein
MAIKTICMHFIDNSFNLIRELSKVKTVQTNAYFSLQKIEVERPKHKVIIIAKCSK